MTGRTPSARIAPFDIEGMLARHRDTMAKAKAIVAAAGPHVPILPDVMTPDHPLAKLLGFEAANALVDTPGRRRRDRAARLRADVRRLSLEGKLVREIAAELRISYNYVVDLRQALGVGRRR